MADGNDLMVCSVCSHDYEVEGEHVPYILSCFHTVCGACIRDKLKQGPSLKCPECDAEYYGRNGTENIRKNEYIISYIKKLANRFPKKEDRTVGREKECSKHGKELNLFCNESRCQTPICISCLKDEHKAHDFSDLDEVTEEICAALLEDVQWMKDTLQRKKDDFLKVQKTVSQNCQECTLDIIDVKTDLVNEINQRAAELVHDITEQKSKVDSRVSEAIANIDEKLIMVKEFEVVAMNKSIFEVETKKLQKFKCAKDEIKSTISETISYTILTYVKCGDMSNCLSLLGGKLTEMRQQMGMETTESVSKDSAAKTDLNKKVHEVIKQKIPACSVSRGSLLQEKGDSNVSVRTTSTECTFEIQSRSCTQDCSHEVNNTVNGSEQAYETKVPIVENLPTDHSFVVAQRMKTRKLQLEMLKRIKDLIPKVYPPKKDLSTNTATHVNSLQPKADRGTTTMRTADNNTAMGSQLAKDADNYAQLKQGRNNKPEVTTDNLTRSQDNLVKKTQPVEKLEMRAKENNTAVNIAEGAQPSLSAGSTQLASNIGENVQPALCIVANNQAAESSTVYNRSYTSNVQPAVNAPGSSPHTTNSLSSQPVESLPKNVQAAVNDAGSILQTTNSWSGKPVELLLSASNVRSVVNATGSIPQTTNILNREPIENSVTNNTADSPPFANNIQRAMDSNRQKTDSWNSRTGENAITNITVSNQQPANNIETAVSPAGSTPVTTNTSNSQLVGNVVTNQMYNLYNGSGNTSTVNPPVAGSMVSYQQSATSVIPLQPSSENSVMCQSAEGTLLNGYPAWWGRYPVYDQVNTTAASYWSEQTMNSTLQPVDAFHHHTRENSQAPVNECNSVTGQWTTFDPPVDTNSPGCYNQDGNTRGNESHGRITTGSKNLRDPRRSTSYKRNGVQIDAEAVAKKARLESTSEERFPTKYRVLCSIITGFEKLNVVDLLPDDSVVVSGKRDTRWSSGRPGSGRLGSQPEFTRYDRTTGQMVGSSWSRDTRMPDGMAVLTTAAGEERLALSYGKRKAIDFYDTKDLRKRLQTHSVNPDNPGRLATSLPGMLVYSDCREDNQLVKWLDCSSFPPKETCVLTNIGTGNYTAQDMCCVRHEEKQLLITTHNIGGVHAYFAGTDDLRWCVGGYQPGMDRYIDAVGITANEQGQLFVCDKANGCVQVLSTEGTFLATVLRNGEQRLGIPNRIRWCQKTKSLVITSKKQGLFSISVFECC